MLGTYEEGKPDVLVRVGAALGKRTHIVEEKRSEKLHDARILHRIDVLGPRRRLGDGLHELHSGLLVLLEDLE